MNALNLKTVLQSVRSLGPYVLIELLLPGGTLIAGLLWLTQQVRRRQDGKAQPRPVAGSVVSLQLGPRLARVRRMRPVLGGLTFQQKLHHLRHDSSSPLIELRRRQVCDRMRHRNEFEIGQAPCARHRRARRLENVRNNGRRRYAVLFEHDAVEDTPRRA